MKQLTTILNFLLAFMLLFFLVGAAYPNFSARAAPPAEAARSESLSCDPSRSVQVSGTAVLNVPPDRVLIQLGVLSNGKTPQKVEMENSLTINRVTRALKALGIAEQDIVTDWYVIDPVYRNYDALTIDGYRINNVVAVTLREISKVNQVLIAALGAGANQVVQIEFYLSDLRSYRDQARELAMKAAGEKARALAAAAGGQTGCVLSISENSWSQYYGGWYGASRDLWTQNVMQNAAPLGGEVGALDEGGPLSLGKISVRAEVSASFSLK